MWSRACEVMLGVWLALSPFIFGHDPSAWASWIIDLSSATVVVILSCLACWSRARYAALGNVLVGLSLFLYGYLASGAPRAPALQNDITLGLLLMMFGIIPSQSSEPPLAWERWYERRGAGSPDGTSAASPDDSAGGT